MQFTVITPSYNQAPFLEETIQSVLNQKTNIEYQVIDGGSTDGSIDLIKRFIGQIENWISEPDNGQSHAINKGLLRATGDIINWLNSDDYYEPNALEVVQHLFTNQLTGLGGRSRLFNSKGTLCFSRGTDIYRDNLPKTIGWARIDQPETFFSKQAWEQVGLLNEDMHYCMDREWWMRYLYQFGLDSFHRIDDVLVNFRIHDDSKTQTAQPGFLKEHHSLYYSMAKVINHEKAMRFMDQSLDINGSLQTDLLNWQNKDLVKHSFNYYLLKSGDSFYANRQFHLARGFIKLVEKSSLAIEDRALLDKLKFRLKLGPLIKLIKP